MDSLHELIVTDQVEFVEIKEEVLTTCMHTCMGSMDGECEKKK